MTLSTRLITTGKISSNTDVNYELTIGNIGQGDYLIGNSPTGSNQPRVYFLMPNNASFTSITDNNTSDNLNVTGCFDIGSIHQFGPSFDGYDGHILQCTFVSPNNILPSGSSYSFNILMHTSSVSIFHLTKLFMVHHLLLMT